MSSSVLTLHLLLPLRLKESTFLKARSESDICLFYFHKVLYLVPEARTNSLSLYLPADTEHYDCRMTYLEHLEKVLKWVKWSARGHSSSMPYFRRLYT